MPCRSLPPPTPHSLSKKKPHHSPGKRGLTAPQKVSSSRTLSEPWRASHSADGPCPNPSLPPAEDLFPAFPTTPKAPPSPVVISRKEKERARKDALRRRDRQEKAEQVHQAQVVPKWPARERAIERHTKDIHAEMVGPSFNDLPHAKPALTGDKSEPRPELSIIPNGASTLEEYQSIGWPIYKNDGSRRLALMTSERKMVAAFFSKPEKEDDLKAHEATCSRAYQTMDEVNNAITDWKPFEQHHRRGDYTSIHGGFSCAGGAHGPPTNHGQTNGFREQMFNGLCSNPDVRTLAGWACAGVASFAPKLASYYRTTMLHLRHRYPKLAFPYLNSPFAHTTFNFGPGVYTVPHADHLNLAYGLCTIFALGDYDHTRGGHLVFHSLRCIVEFPPNTCCAIMSAAVVHSNLPIQPGERRASITQYTAAGLFRWAHNGFKANAKKRNTAANNAKDCGN